MTIGTYVEGFRADAEEQMVDACAIDNQTGETTDPDTGAVVPTFGPAVY